MEKNENKEPIYIYCSIHDKKEDIVRRVKSNLNQTNGFIILEMIRIDLDIIEAVHKVAGRRLRIMPYYGQERKRVGYWSFPYYTYKKILESEKTINMYASSLADHPDKDGDIKSLSPFEKFIAAYIIDTKFARYKHEDKADTSLKNYHVSRSVHEITLNKEDRRIVCVGYVNFLRELLYRVGIKDTASISFGFYKEPKNRFGGLDGHERMLIHLKDPKYNKDGVYMSDPTQDSNGLHCSSIDHMLMTYQEVYDDDPRFEMDLDEGLIGKNEYSTWQLKNEYDNYDFKEELFHDPIDDDTIVKAFLAVEHFLDKEMKMVENNEYGSFEYCEMALKLSMFDLIDDKKQKETFDEAIKYNHKELNMNYPKIAKWIISKEFNERLQKKYGKYGDFYYKRGDKGLGKIVYSLLGLTNIDDPWTSRWDELVYEFDDRPIIEQFDSVYQACESFLEELRKRSGK